MIFNVIILMRAYIHTGAAWAHRQRVSTINCDSEKLSQFFLVLLKGFELGSLL